MASLSAADAARSPAARVEGPNPRFLALSFAALFGMGAVVCLLTLAMPHPHDRSLLGLAGPIVAALALALSLLLWGERVPLRFFYALPPFGSLLVAIVSYSGGSGLRVAYAVFFFWAIASAFYFFPRRVAIPNVPFVALLYALVLWIGHEPFGAIRYFSPIAALTVTAVLIDRLNAERERLHGEVQKMIEGLHTMARTDPLTGIANRREFEDHLARELARAGRFGSRLSVLMIDLDHFKAFNDRFGHLAGDALLSEVAAAWRRLLRVSDLLVRYGGEEFAVILPDCEVQDAESLAERVRLSVPDDQTCSVGIATWDGTESDVRLMRRADNALIRAKRLGRNRIYRSTAEQALQQA